MGRNMWKRFCEINIIRRLHLAVFNYNDLWPYSQSSTHAPRSLKVLRLQAFFGEADSNVFIKHFSAHNAYSMSGPSFSCWLSANYAAPYFKRVHKILRKGLLASSCPSVRPAPTGRIFVKLYIEIFFFY